MTIKEMCTLGMDPGPEKKKILIKYIIGTICNIWISSVD